MKKPLKDMAASVRARLATLAKAEGRTFDSILLLYFQERLLARLAASPHRDRFVLKGALLFFAKAPEGMARLRARPTKDIDFLGRDLAADLPVMVRAFRDIVAVPMEDGVAFDPESVVAERIKEDADYEGVRLHVVARLGQARGRLQIDVGFGDVITPKVQKARYPVLLDADAPEVWCYPFESVVAEKFEAVIKLSIQNSRMKDFFDLYHIASTQAFVGAVLQEAIQQTFRRRGTELRPDTLVFSDAFRDDPSRQTQWVGYLRKAKLSGVPTAFPDAMGIVARFLGPVHAACSSGAAFGGRWLPAEHTWTAT